MVLLRSSEIAGLHTETLINDRVNLKQFCGALMREIVAIEKTKSETAANLIS